MLVELLLFLFTYTIIVSSFMLPWLALADYRPGVFNFMQHLGYRVNARPAETPQENARRFLRLLGATMLLGCAFLHSRPFYLELALFQFIVATIWYIDNSQRFRRTLLGYTTFVLALTLGLTERMHTFALPFNSLAIAVVPFVLYAIGVILPTRNNLKYVLIFVSAMLICITAFSRVASLETTLPVRIDLLFGAIFFLISYDAQQHINNILHQPDYHRSWA